MKTLAEAREHLNAMSSERLHFEYVEQGLLVREATLDPRFGRQPVFESHIPREMLAEEILRMLAYLAAGRAEEGAS